MTKTEKIKQRILEHREEIKRLIGSNTLNLSARKGIEMQLSHLRKSISQLSIKYIKAGGKSKDLEGETSAIVEKEKVSEESAPSVVKKPKRTKKGRK